MEHHRSFEKQFRNCLFVSPSLAVAFAENLKLDVSTVRSWIVNPPVPSSVLFWKTAWLIHEQGYLCREIAERSHLYDLFFAITHGDSHSKALFAMDISEAELLRIIVRRNKLSRRQRDALEPFVTDIQVRHNDESSAAQLAELLKEASASAVKLNGKSVSVGAILRARYSEIVDPLAVLLKG